MKGLGIVLTPRHVAELFADLAEVNRDSIVVDNCCGTAGLLIAAMKAMMRDAGPDDKLKKRIRNQQLYGIEYQPKIYALAVSNMILHGDGKTNIFRGDCFEDAMRLVAPHKPYGGPPEPTVQEQRWISGILAVALPGWWTFLYLKTGRWPYRTTLEWLGAWGLVRPGWLMNPRDRFGLWEASLPAWAGAFIVCGLVVAVGAYVTAELARELGAHQSRDSSPMPPSS